MLQKRSPAFIEPLSANQNANHTETLFKVF